MLQRLGVANRSDLAMLLCLIGLVAITPLGREATHPFLIIVYRTLLLGILIVYAIRPDRLQLRRVCPYFSGVILAVMGVTLLSLSRWPASLTEAFFVFYENALFALAFLALAHLSPLLPARWKQTLLLAVVALAGAALLLGADPVKGPFVNPNYLASYTLPALAVCLAAVISPGGATGRIAAAIGGALLFYGILQTSSRGASLVGAALIGLAILRAARRRGISWGRVAAGVSVAVAAAAIAVVLLTPNLTQKFMDRGENDPYNYARLGVWRETAVMIATHPILGVGLGNYYHVAKQFTPPVDGAIARYMKWPNIAHSEYLQFAAEIGAPGALLLFAAGGYLLFVLWRRADHAAADKRWSQEAALLAAIGLGLHALVDNNWVVPVLAAGLAVVGQADVLPYRDGLRWAWRSRMWRPALAIALAAVWIHAALLPGVAFYLNDAGHRAFVAGDLEHAERYHRYALGFAPRHPVLLDNLGQVYLSQYMMTKKADRLELAEFAFADALKENPNFNLPASHMESALIQRLRGDVVRDAAVHHRLLENNRRALEANPFSVFVRRNLAEALYNLGQRDLAAAELTKALEIEPFYVPGYLRMAEWRNEAGDAAGAARLRGQAIQIVQRFKDHKTVDPYEDRILGRPIETDRGAEATGSRKRAAQ